MGGKGQGGRLGMEVKKFENSWKVKDVWFHRYEKGWVALTDIDEVEMTGKVSVFLSLRELVEWFHLREGLRDG